MKKDGGPAFPATVQDDIDCAGRYVAGYGGMSLRDWFAGKALAGLVPNAAWDYSSGPCNAAAAQRCYAIADAMLAEREKE